MNQSWQCSTCDRKWTPWPSQGPRHGRLAGSGSGGVEATDDVSYFAHALGVVALTRNMSQLARDARMSREGLYKALSSDGHPSFASILKITRSLGLRLAFEPA